MAGVFDTDIFDTPNLAVEQEPQQDADGVWRQAWVLEPAPEPEPEISQEPVIDLLASLTEGQKATPLSLLSNAN